jgi:hypothetical protein
VQLTVASADGGYFGVYQRVPRLMLRICKGVVKTATASQIASFTRCGDSALWTGHYLAAEAFRYNVTQASDALNHLKSAIGWLKGLTDVTGTGYSIDENRRE